ncbi:MAG: dihydroorotase [Nitrospinae bacterium RIFCSPHIGHO2_12_FULL_39_42]|nr:MAG: dihydroorotase [Nitrospinae bacterium RIFCSPHIGHO2_02_39_11]OGW01125.1 MAG: dihydroorotase [Nitrospinae bacterium RIFCSPHIGHO2_12_FULL_39_42]
MILIKNGRVIDPANKIDAILDILIENGRITEIGKAISHQPSAISLIDASGKIVVPGLIDMHVHLREPGYEYKETVKTGAESALAGGFTSIACMPNTKPVNDNQSVTDFILDKARKEGVVNVYPIGAITKGLKGEELAEIGELKSSGVVAITDDGKPVMNSELMRRGMEYASMFDLPVISHCEDLKLSEGGVMNEGFVSTELGLKGIPDTAEVVMVARDIALAELTGAKLHIAHVSTRGAVSLIKGAKLRGVNITCETAPHYFTITEKEVIGYDTNAKMNPPLRTEDDLKAIKEGLRDGTIDVIATDHAPHEVSEKEVEFDRALFGIVGLETALPLTLKLAHNGVISISEAISKLTINPARILGLNKGTLSVGSDADITIIDLDKEWQVDVTKFKSKGKNSPFQGWHVKGVVEVVIVGGHIKTNYL